MHSVRVDAKGRLSIPKEAREELAVKPGDVFYVQVEGSILQFAKAPNLFDALAEEAEAEYRAGRTRNLRDLAHELSVESGNFVAESGATSDTAPQRRSAR